MELRSDGGRGWEETGQVTSPPPSWDTAWTMGQDPPWAYPLGSTPTTMARWQAVKEDPTNQTANFKEQIRQVSKIKNSYI